MPPSPNFPRGLTFWRLRRDVKGENDPQIVRLYVQGAELRAVFFFVQLAMWMAPCDKWFTAGGGKAYTTYVVHRSRWLRTTNLPLPTLNCSPANTSSEYGMSNAREMQRSVKQRKHREKTHPSRVTYATLPTENGESGANIGEPRAVGSGKRALAFRSSSNYMSLKGKTQHIYTPSPAHHTSVDCQSSEGEYRSPIHTPSPTQAHLIRCQSSKGEDVPELLPTPKKKEIKAFLLYFHHSLSPHRNQLHKDIHDEKIRQRTSVRINLGGRGEMPGNFPAHKMISPNLCYKNDSLARGRNLPTRRCAIMQFSQVVKSEAALSSQVPNSRSQEHSECVNRRQAVFCSEGRAGDCETNLLVSSSDFRALFARCWRSLRKQSSRPSEMPGQDFWRGAENKRSCQRDKCSGRGWLIGWATGKCEFLARRHTASSGQLASSIYRLFHTQGISNLSPTLSSTLLRASPTWCLKCNAECLKSAFFFVAKPLNVHATQRNYCTPVLRLARRSVWASGARVSVVLIAPALLCLGRAKNLETNLFKFEDILRSMQCCCRNRSGESWKFFRLAAGRETKRLRHLYSLQTKREVSLPPPPHPFNITHTIVVAVPAHRSYNKQLAKLPRRAVVLSVNSRGPSMMGKKGRGFEQRQLQAEYRSESYYAGLSCHLTKHVDATVRSEGIRKEQVEKRHLSPRKHRNSPPEHKTLQTKWRHSCFDAAIT
ncbi:hypothetical protein PR048_029107 [Dryococelus australis]|uniref:Uncharacterized protein n=1 Tax=Dryococelus australis TaxID=614101 RepID=A0ABQ9GCF3_9NEOP|nr:hypothetical protein PR048_029107 [Dryococelus australis]